MRYCARRLASSGNTPIVTIIQPVNGLVSFDGQPVLLSANAFDIEDGDLNASIQWSFSLDGMLGSGTALNVALTPGEHTLMASVTDAQGNSTEASTLVTVVVNAPPTVAITEPAGDVTLIEGASLMLSGSASDAEDGVLTDAIQWSSDVGGTLGTGASHEVMLSVGTHQLAAAVIDSHGKSGVANRQVSVVFNNPPQLSLTSPEDGQQIEQYLPLALSAVATDQEDGDLSAVITWVSEISGSLGTGGAVETSLSLGAHAITASITDGNGKTTSVTRSVTVSAPPVSGNCGVSGATKSMWVEGVNIAGVTNTSGSQGGYADCTWLGPVYLDRAANAIELVPGFSHQNRNVN